jgi:glutamine amidotransferase
MIAILDYGSGNTTAIANIFKELNAPHFIARDFGEVGKADKYILPGVGHFDQTMRTIRERNLYDVLEENVVGKGKLLLGICVGMQVLGEDSEEGVEKGFGWIAGSVRKIRPSSAAHKLPHMGWNSISYTDNHNGLLSGIDASAGFYFLHSYCFHPADPEAAFAVTDHGETLCCGVTNSRNVYGVQFHPEKSHGNGTRLFKNFVDM